LYSPEDTTSVRLAIVSVHPKSLDVVLLLDDSRELPGVDVSETFLFVSEAVEALEASLTRLGHTSRRLSFDRGVLEVIGELSARRPDVVFPLGQPAPMDSEDEARVVSLLELLHLPHTSESPTALTLSRDKARAKALLLHHHIATPGHAVSRDGSLPGRLPNPPWIVKPALQDGSVGVTCDVPANEEAVLAERVRSSFSRFQEPILIETFLNGREFQIGLVGGHVLPFIEIDYSRLPNGRPPISGYPTKWKYESPEFAHTHYSCPANVDEGLAERLRGTARATADAFQLARCARLDVRLDTRGVVHVLDVNPNPDLSPVATFHKMAEAAGWGFDGVVTRLLQMATSQSSFCHV
jgi:D-alanine-D-alanine ligase